MALLNNEAALKIAKELTITAMEHSMIKANVDPSITAENVFNFYKSLVEKFRETT